VISFPDRVSLEKDGSDRIVDKRDVVLVTDEELKEKPFKRIFISPESSAQSGGGGEGATEKDKKKKSHPKSNKREREEENERDSRSSQMAMTKKQKSDRREAGGGEGGGGNGSSPSWLQTGIRVKIISKKIDDHGRHYLSKGSVIDVYYPSSSSSKSSRDRSSSKVASLRLDNGVVLQDVKEKYLETVLPKNIGDSCMVLTGEYRGLSGTLMEKDYERNEVTIQLTEEMEILLLSMDSVAALA
jgi:G patch domain and KOW motifs-containing protein